MPARYGKTAHRCKVPLGSVIVTSPIHPLHGQQLDVRNVKQQAGFIEICVSHPDGGVLTLPAWATDHPSSSAMSGPSESTGPLFAPRKLLELCEHVARMATNAADTEQKAAIVSADRGGQAGGNPDDGRASRRRRATPSGTAVAAHAKARRNHREAGQTYAGKRTKHGGGSRP